MLAPSCRLNVILDWQCWARGRRLILLWDLVGTQRIVRLVIQLLNLEIMLRFGKERSSGGRRERTLSHLVLQGGFEIGVIVTVVGSAESVPASAEPRQSHNTTFFIFIHLLQELQFFV